MREKANIQAISQLSIDLLGLIFYEKSQRFIEAEAPDFEQFLSFSDLDLLKVGVFVNAEIPFLLEKTGEYHLDYVQLHGSESTEYCQNLKSVWPTIKIIKAFSVNDDFDFTQTKSYEPFCDLFLFDTKGKNRGGNGVKFNWNILKNYHGMRPFLLSGGIDKDDVEDIKKIEHKLLWGVDVNSGFEVEPGLKNIEDLASFSQKLNTK